MSRMQELKQLASIKVHEHNGDMVNYRYTKENYTQPVCAIITTKDYQISMDNGDVIDSTEHMASIRICDIDRMPYEHDEITFNGVVYRVLQPINEFKGVSWRMRLHVHNDENNKNNKGYFL
jgi:hypothetical protein